MILATLVGQGLTLPLLVRGLGVADDGGVEHEARKARLLAAKAALGRLEELVAEEWTTAAAIGSIRDHYADRVRHLAEDLNIRLDGFGDPDDGHDPHHLLIERRVRREVIASERRAILHLRDAGKIGDEAMRQIERDLDLEDLRLA